MTKEQANVMLTTLGFKQGEIIIAGSSEQNCGGWEYEIGKDDLLLINDLIEAIKDVRSLITDNSEHVGINICLVME